MSMLDVARYLSYSRAVDVGTEGERFFNISMANTNHLFSCLHGDSRHWCFGRQQREVMHPPSMEESKG